MRKIINLNQDWKFKKDDEMTLSANPANRGWEKVELPHTWNRVDGQDGGNDYWRGKASYVKEFSKPDMRAGDEVWLEITGAAMSAVVYLNGKELLSHQGGFSTFRVDLTEALAEKNTLRITVDNSENDTVYPQKADFTFYGGLYRNVNLILVPEKHFALGYAGGTGIKVTPELSDDLKSAVVNLEAWTTKSVKNVSFQIYDQDGNTWTDTAEVKDGYAFSRIYLEKVHLWDGVVDPYLYTAEAVIKDSDCVQTTFGCRRIIMDPQKGTFLNGRSYPLRGAARHQDRKDAGNAITRKMMDQDMNILREMGANTVRLAHYQHDSYFYDLCDRYGIIVWAEIPYITAHMKNGKKNTLSQMRELIVQNYNHPSICCWGLSNEITASTPVTEDLLENHRCLNKLCHRMDPTRPTTMANVFMLETDSPILEIPDINSYNLYYGWYLGELSENDEFFDAYHSKYPERVIGFSEYGADANPAFQSSEPEKGDYTEGYQCLYHEHMLQMIEKRPWLWATHLWNLFDFAADGRDEGGKHGENQKGLVSFDRSLKKDAFYVYKAYWSKEPFVHICGRRYVDRTENVTEIKVYSNQNEVTLLVDGELQETKKGEHIFIFRVPISGKHTIMAMAGDFCDKLTVRYVNEPNQDYRFKKGGDVTNWFDRGTIDKAYYSIEDTLGELRKTSESAQIVDNLMAKTREKRGDVAKATAGNKVLEQMMNKMTLEQLLKSGGDEIKPEQVKELNRQLQQIKKNR